MIPNLSVGFNLRHLDLDLTFFDKPEAIIVLTLLNNCLINHIVYKLQFVNDLPEYLITDCSKSWHISHHSQHKFEIIILVPCKILVNSLTEELELIK